MEGRVKKLAKEWAFNLSFFILGLAIGFLVIWGVGECIAQTKRPPSLMHQARANANILGKYDTYATPEIEPFAQSYQVMACNRKRKPKRVVCVVREYNTLIYYIDAGELVLEPHIDILVTTYADGHWVDTWAPDAKTTHKPDPYVS